MIFPDLWPTLKTAQRACAEARSKSVQASVLGNLPSRQLNVPKSLLYISNRGLGTFSAPRTGFSLPRPILKFSEDWGLKPLAVGALSKMVCAQARVQRKNKRALKFKFLFAPHLIPDPETWLSEHTGLDVEIEILDPDPTCQPSGGSNANNWVTRIAPDYSRNISDRG
jgi:hypothetical protein